ncbi:helix-turn-helix transcriptional regulator [Streptomyces sp. NPDC059352]|uniref:helix-turn-helix transcriptional regulator n=1 Tax=Streptomyces sp. NPDC059352 TaxID=3346810 RepID=UPI0036B66535
MVATGAPAPPPGRDGVTFAEIAAHYGMSTRYVAENPRWGRHPEWPESTGKRGRSLEFPPAPVAEFVAEHHTRDAVELAPDQLYSVTEIAEAAGIRPDSIHSDISRGRWPAPDADGEGGPSMWKGATVTAYLAARRTYRRSV